MSELLFPNGIRTLLADDETIATNRLKKVLKQHPEIAVIGEVTDGQAAIDFIHQHRPDLVFLDIQMPGINGFDVLQALDYQPMVVFVTAYDAYAIKAFEVNSLDYLLKPVEEERLALTIRRVLARHSGDVNVLSTIRKLLADRTNTDIISTIPVKAGARITLLPITDVCFFEARDKYVYIHTKEACRLTEFSLLYLQERLPSYFVRIHRSFIINKLKIQEIHKHLKGTYVLRMADVNNTQIRSAYSYADVIKQQLLLS